MFCARVFTHGDLNLGLWFGRLWVLSGHFCGGWKVCFCIDFSSVIPCNRFSLSFTYLLESRAFDFITVECG